MSIDIQDVKRLRLVEGDTLVLYAAANLGAAAMEALSVELKAAFPDHKTIVLMDPARLEVVAVPSSPTEVNHEVLLDFVPKNVRRELFPDRQRRDDATS